MAEMKTLWSFVVASLLPLSALADFVGVPECGFDRCGW